MRPELVSVLKVDSLPDKPPEAPGGKYDPYLRGTTYRVYRYMLRQRKPVGLSEIQRSLGLSSPSVSEYHIGKLLRMGLVRQEQEGYVIDRVVFDNVVRIRRFSIPTQSAYVVFFCMTFLLFLTLFRPAQINSVYYLAVVVNGAALCIFLYEMRKTLQRF